MFSVHRPGQHQHHPLFRLDLHSYCLRLLAFEFTNSRPSKQAFEFSTRPLLTPRFEGATTSSITRSTTALLRYLYIAGTSSRRATQAAACTTDRRRANETPIRIYPSLPSDNLLDTSNLYNLASFLLPAFFTQLQYRQWAVPHTP